jgi:hypothetical protein
LITPDSNRLFLTGLASHLTTIKAVALLPTNPLKFQSLNASFKAPLDELVLIAEPQPASSDAASVFSNSLWTEELEDLEKDLRSLFPTLNPTPTLTRLIWSCVFSFALSFFFCKEILNDKNSVKN